MDKILLVVILIIAGLLFIAFWTIILRSAWRIGQKIRDFIFPPKK